MFVKKTLGMYADSIRMQLFCFVIAYIMGSFAANGLDMMFQYFSFSHASNGCLATLHAGVAAKIGR